MKKNRSVILNVMMLATALSSQMAFADCKYELKENSTKVEWTAFKTTAKKGVKGTFSTVAVYAPQKKMDLKHALEHVQISLDVLSIVSGDPKRDANLVNSFFIVAEGRKVARGSLKEIKGTDEQGEATLILYLNDTAMHKVKAEYSMNSDGDFSLKAKLNVLDYGFKGALESLSKACAELHKGTDGVSKTWPDVELLITAKVDKSC